MTSDRPEESFAALFEKSGQSTPAKRQARVGETVDALVVQVGRDAIFVELGGRQQGFIESVDLRAPDGTIKATEGEKIRARIVSVGDDGIRLMPTVEAAAAVGASVNLAGNSEPDAVKYAIGQVVSGTADRIESYGVFLQIEGTKGRAGRGLIPVSELGTTRGADLRKLFPIGTKLKAKIIGLEEGKMRLSVNALKDDEERADYEGFAKGKETQAAAAPVGFGTLGELFKKKARK